MNVVCDFQFDTLIYAYYTRINVLLQIEIVMPSTLGDLKEDQT